MASSSTLASPNDSYHVFINHRGVDVKKTLASHLYHRLRSAIPGLRVFLDKPELRVGNDFPSQIQEAIRTASVHVAIFSRGYAESEWCLNELFYMLESGVPIIPIFYHVQPADLRRTQSGDGVYSMGLRRLEPQYDSTTLQKWRDALSRVSHISGLDLQDTCNGDEGELVEKVVQRVSKEIDSIFSVGIGEFCCSQLYGGLGGSDRSDGTYSGFRRITMTATHDLLTSVQLHYGLEGDESVKDKYMEGFLYGNAVGSLEECNLNYPEEFVTKLSGYFERFIPSPEFGFVIKSLTFHTNQRKFGPCGPERGTYFETDVIGKIVGLFGRSGDLLDSIGVYMQKPRISK